MPIPTEPIGSIPRPAALVEGMRDIRPTQLGTTDDCGFSPFADDVSTSRETAFEKIRARVIGTQLAARSLGF